MVETSIRHRVLLEPRGFIRVIEFVLAIIAFATTGGYHSESIGTLKCGENPKSKKFTVPISYPFNLEADKINVPTCNSNNTGYGPDAQVQLTGDFSPTSQWFVFVGVMAFLICLATIVFYVAFETSIRATNESAVTVTDLVVTVIWAFLWLTAASAWAWGVNQIHLQRIGIKLFKAASVVTKSGSASNKWTPAMKMLDLNEWIPYVGRDYSRGFY